MFNNGSSPSGTRFAAQIALIAGIAVAACLLLVELGQALGVDAEVMGIGILVFLLTWGGGFVLLSLVQRRLGDRTLRARPEQFTVSLLPRSTRVSTVARGTTGFCCSPRRDEMPVAYSMMDKGSRSSNADCTASTMRKANASSSNRGYSFASLPETRQPLSLIERTSEASSCLDA